MGWGCVQGRKPSWTGFSFFAPLAAPWELKSLFLPGPKLDIAINSPLPHQDLALPPLAQPAVVPQQSSSSLGSSEGSAELSQGLEELRGTLGVATDGEGKQENSKDTLNEGVRAVIPQLFAPLAVAISFLPARAGVAPPCPCALLRAAPHSPLLPCKRSSPGNPFLRFLAGMPLIPGIWKSWPWPVPAPPASPLFPGVTRALPHPGSSTGGFFMS